MSHKHSSSRSHADTDEVIDHESADWNSFRTSSSRGQVLRNFIAQGLPRDKAKLYVEEELEARKPRPASRKGGSKLRPSRPRTPSLAHTESTSRRKSPSSASTIAGFREEGRQRRSRERDHLERRLVATELAYGGLRLETMMRREGN